MRNIKKKIIHEDVIITKPSKSGSGGGGNMTLEQKVDNLDKDVRDMRLELAEMKGQIPHLATKAELSAATAKIVFWIVGVAIVLGSFNWVTNSFFHAHPVNPPGIQSNK